MCPYDWNDHQRETPNLHKLEHTHELSPTQPKLSHFVNQSLDDSQANSTEEYCDALSEKEPILHDATKPISSDQVSNIYLAIQQLAIEQKRVTKIVENFAFRESTSSFTSISSNSTSFHQIDTSSTESHKSCISFVPIGTMALDPLTTPQQIEALPVVDSTTLANYRIAANCLPSDVDSHILDQHDYRNYTAMLKIIGAPTNDVTQFTSLLVLRNRWLKLRYLHVNRIYQTETSYSRSFNYIVT